jgi:hypothetical protein
LFDIALKVRELGPAEHRDHAVPRHPDDVTILLRLYYRIPDLAVPEVVVVELRRAIPKQARSKKRREVIITPKMWGSDSGSGTGLTHKRKPSSQSFKIYTNYHDYPQDLQLQNVRA